MLNFTRNRVLKLTVMIALAVIAVCCVCIAVGTSLIMDAEQHTTTKQTSKLTEKRMKYYDRHTDIDAYAMSVINDRNKSSIASIINEEKEGQPLLELYINFEKIDLEQPLSSIETKLNTVMEYGVGPNMMEFCKRHRIDYQQTPIAEVESEVFLDLLDDLRLGKEWTYVEDFNR